MMVRGGLAGLAVLSVLALSFSTAAQTKTPASTTAQVKDALQTCYQCHGPGGVSVIPSRPSIAGQKAEYVRRQLMAFRKAAAKGLSDQDGDADDKPSMPALPGRTDPVMEHMAAGLPQDLIAPVAEAVAKLACDGGNPRPLRPNPMARPKAANKCVICHGADGLGVQNHVPNLAGQQRSYLRRQLLLIRETAWGAQPREGEAWRSHPIMEAQAARIRIADVDAIARYYAGLNCAGDGAKTVK